jgi:hypothetical protein
MRPLVVIHAENGYVDEEFEKAFGRGKIEENAKLFTDIADEMKSRIKKEGEVYFIPVESETPDSGCMFPAIREISSDLIFIGEPSRYEGKILYVKERLIDEGVKGIDVAGVAYGLCVDDFFRLCYGNNSEPSITKEMLQDESERLGWSKEKFETVYNTILDAHILERLTDKNHKY